MKQFLKLLFLLLLCAIPAFGQGVRYDNFVLKPLAIGGVTPVSGALITVCTSAGTGTPCTPKVANIYSDQALTVPLTGTGGAGTTNSDANGNYGFYIAPGDYVITVTGSGISSSTVKLTLPCAASNCALSTLTISGAATLNGGATGNNTTPGANDYTLGILNNERYVCSLSAAYRFQTLQSAITDILNNGTAGTGRIYTCPGHTETITSQLDLGTSAHGVVIHGGAGTQITCNITAGGTNACFNVHQGSGLVGQSTGTWGANVGGFTISIPATANVKYVFDTPEGSGGAGQSYATVSHIFVRVTAGATISNSVVHLQGISGNMDYNNIHVFVTGVGTTTTYGVLLEGGSNAEGPILLSNMFVDCGYVAGCKPIGIISNTGAVLPVDVVGGFYNHPGTGLPNLTIDGSGNVGGSGIRGIRLKTFIENQQGAGSIGVSLKDARNVVFDAFQWSMNTNDTVVDISETAVGRSTNIHLIGGWGFGATNVVNNHISGELFTQAAFFNTPFYHFGGENNSGNALQLPFTISMNSMLVSNFADATMEQTFSSGKTAAQTNLLTLADRSTKIASFGINASPQVFIKDISTGVTPFDFTPGGITDVNAQGANPFRVNRGAGTGGLQVFNGSSTLLGQWDSSGDLTFHGGASSSFKLTGTPTAARTITAPDAAAAIPSFLNCGTTSTCAQTNATRLITLNGGPIALAAGTLTITSLPFTSSTSYVCSADDSTGINGIDVVYVSGSSVTFNGTGTDSIRYACQGN